MVRFSSYNLRLILKIMQSTRNKDHIGRMVKWNCNFYFRILYFCLEFNNLFLFIEHMGQIRWNFIHLRYSTFDFNCIFFNSLINSLKPLFAIFPILIWSHPNSNFISSRNAQFDIHQALYSSLLILSLSNFLWHLFSSLHFKSCSYLA